MHAVQHSAFALHNMANSAAHKAAETHRPSACCTHAGSFALRAGRALSLRPQDAAVLRITHGAAWVTLPSLPGDHILRAGDSLPVSPGDAVVLEAWHMPISESLYFDWDAASVQVLAADGMAVRGRLQGQTAPAGGRNVRGLGSKGSWASWGTLSPSYCEAVLAPLADLRGAVVLGGGAAARLALGLAAWTLGKLLDMAMLVATSRARASTL